MPHGIYTETDIPEKKVNAVIATLNLEDPPPTKTQKIQQPNGNYTVIATWPDGTDTGQE
jgi:hypothetical protein